MNKLPENCKRCLSAHLLKMVVLVLLLIDLGLSVDQLYNIEQIASESVLMITICLSRAVVVWLISGIAVTFANRIIMCCIPH